MEHTFRKNMDPTSSVKSFNQEVHGSLEYTIALYDRWTFEQGKQ